MADDGVEEFRQSVDDAEARVAPRLVALDEARRAGCEAIAAILLVIEDSATSAEEVEEARWGLLELRWEMAFGEQRRSVLVQERVEMLHQLAEAEAKTRGGRWQG